MKQRKKYPKTASVFGVVAGALFVAGFLNVLFFFPAVFLGLIALILAIGPDDNDFICFNINNPSSNSMGQAYRIPKRSQKN